MPALVPPVADEREGLLGYLALVRSAVRVAAYGLTDEQARRAPTPSALSVGGLVKHLASTEQGWINLVMLRDRAEDLSEAQDEYEADFHLAPDETLAGALDRYAEVAKETEAVIAGITDLGQPVPVPRGVPWYPDDLDAWSVRWVLLHLIEETARHAGHADIVREAVDGATAYELMAAAEGWPATDWIQPWQPGPSRAASVLRVQEDGRPIEFTFDELLHYHGHSAPAGVAHAFKVMERAFPLLDPDGPVERREVEITTAFAGPGARDAFEAVTRAVTGDRYTVDAALEQPERGPTMANFVFHLTYRGRTVRLQLRPGHVSEEFIELVRKPDLTDDEDERLRRLKLEMADRLLGQDAAEIYDQV